MQVSVQSLNQTAAKLAAFVERRVRFSMRRREDVVPQVTVTLEEVRGLRGGPDKECRIAMRTAGHGTVISRALATTWRSAVHVALMRAVQIMARVLGRKQARRRALPHSIDAA